MCRDLQFLPSPVEHNEFNRRRSCRLRKRFPPPNDLHQKTNFGCAFKPIPPVQISREKYSARRYPQISRILLASRLVQRGVSRSSRTWRRGAVAASDRSIVLWACGRTIAARTAKPCGSDVPTLAPSLRRRSHVSQVTGAKKPGPRGEHGATVPTTAQGRPGIFGCTCGSAACFFSARGPWVPAGARSSLRPLALKRVCLRKARTQLAPRERDASAV
jgi:hypothetical protein